MDSFIPTEGMASSDDALSPEIRKKLELAISQRLNPQKAIMHSMHEIREYAVREGLTREIFANIVAGTASRNESRTPSGTPSGTQSGKQIRH